MYSFVWYYVQLFKKKNYFCLHFSSIQSQLETDLSVLVGFSDKAGKKHNVTLW